eukprot:CAMPEP_0202005130 /NCGR_PEP_ID=MMETSP0905-20130828/10266_1 /ASSEMBLY_ACC=CAM_ASM_000554 /TAXON_ID=420261 /ORGANISM="Thalassiosira antarctica, Strain CCMP982" /LENGTH=52 /DNA_ID=CAMNT_0048562639 /DNA_START=13 /DNA_END=167 /DNA_ORIENTATION=+
MSDNSARNHLLHVVRVHSAGLSRIFVFPLPHHALLQSQAIKAAAVGVAVTAG